MTSMKVSWCAPSASPIKLLITSCKQEVRMSRLQISAAAYAVTGGGSAKDSVSLLCNEQQVFRHHNSVPSMSSSLCRESEDVSRPRPRMFYLSRKEWVQFTYPPMWACFPWSMYRHMVHERSSVSHVSSLRQTQVGEGLL